MPERFYFDTEGVDDDAIKVDFVWLLASALGNVDPPARQLSERWRTIFFMSNLIAKIRHWLHLEKKPKT